MNDIIVGVDRSETARRAAEKAAALAAALGANLHVVMSAEHDKGVNMSVGGDTFRSDWVSETNQFLTDLGRSLKSGALTTSVADGDPAKAICAEARRLEAQLIVVGNKRVQGLARVLGSVASDVIRLAPCDVYVANTTGG